MQSLRARWQPLVLVVLSFMAYANSLQGGYFILDDESSILGNFDIHQIFPLWREAERSSSPAVTNRPVLRLSLALNYAWDQYEFAGYRLVNIGIHLLCGLALYAVGRRALLSPVFAERYNGIARELALAIALIWLVHPLNTQCVNHTIQRSTSLMGLWYLLALLCVQRGIAADGNRWYAAAVAACALGMGTKEAMVTAPVAVLLYDRTFVAGSFGRALIERKGLYAGLASTWILLAILVSSNPHGTSIDLSQPTIMWHYALNQARIIPEHYVFPLFWPSLLTNFYGPIRYTDLADVWPYALLTCGLLAATIYALWRRPVIGFAGIWFFLLLMPTSSVAAIFWEAMAERRPYVAMTSVIALVVVGTYTALSHLAAQGRLSARALRVVCVGMLAVTTLALGVRTAVRNHDYLDLERLWNGEVVYVERVIASLGEISTKVAWYHADAYVQLARAHLAADKWDQALALYSSILARSPNNFKAHKWLGYAYYERQMFDEAIHHFRRVVELDPTAYSIHNVLGTLLCERGAIDEGIGHLRRSVAIVPSYVWGHNNLGAALMLQGNTQEARRHFEQALSLAPVFAPAQENLKALEQNGKP